MWKTLTKIKYNARDCGMVLLKIIQNHSKNQNFNITSPFSKTIKSFDNEHVDSERGLNYLNTTYSIHRRLSSF